MKTQRPYWTVGDSESVRFRLLLALYTWPELVRFGAGMQCGAVQGAETNMDVFAERQDLWPGGPIAIPCRDGRLAGPLRTGIPHTDAGRALSFLAALDVTKAELLKIKMPALLPATRAGMVLRHLPVFRPKLLKLPQLVW